MKLADIPWGKQPSAVWVKMKRYARIPLRGEAYIDLWDDGPEGIPTQFFMCVFPNNRARATYTHEINCLVELQALLLHYLEGNHEL